jgi:hypothetical protein
VRFLTIAIMGGYRACGTDHWQAHAHRDRAPGNLMQSSPDAVR